MIEKIHGLSYFVYDQLENPEEEKLLEIRPAQKFREKVYCGQWHKETNLPHGKGIMVSNHTVHEGYFKEGLKVGKTRII